MGLNFGGLGFAFLGKDEGLKAQATGASTALTNLAVQSGALQASVDGASKSLADLGTQHAAVGADVLTGSTAALSEQLDAANKKNELLTTQLTSLTERFGKTLPRAEKKSEKGMGAFRGEVEKSAKATDLLKDVVDSLHRMLDVQRVQAWMSALSSERIEAARDSIRALTNANMNLTTGFEAQQQALHEGARRTGANMGFAGEQLRQFAGASSALANSTNRDVGVATAAVANWNWSANELRSAGFRSARELLQIQDVTGASAATIADSVRSLIGAYHLSGEQASQVIGSLTHMGETTGDVGAALNLLPQIMSMVSQEAANMGENLDPARLAEIVRQTSSFGAALWNAHLGGHDAQETTMQLGQALLSARQHMTGLLHGIQDDIPALANSMGIAQGDVRAAFDQMSQGPEHFISGFATMIANVRRNHGNVAEVMSGFTARFNEAFGPEQGARLSNFFRGADEATLRSMASFTGTTDRLRTLARQGFSTGRTLQESFDLARESAIASFRAIGRADATHIVRDMSAEFRVFNDAVRSVAREGGPLGMLAERLSAAHQIGALAFVPRTLRPISVLMGTVASEIGPAVLGLHQMGFGLSSLINPLTPLLVGLGLLTMRFIDLRMHGASTGEAVNQLADSLSTGLRRLPELVAQAFDYVAGALGSAGSSLGGVDWRGIWAKLLDSAKAALRQLKPLFADLAMGFLHELTGAFDAPGASSAGRVGSRVGQLLHDGLLAAAGFITGTVLPAGVALVRDLFTGIFEGLSGGGANLEGTAAFGQVLGGAVRTAALAALDYARTTVVPAVRDFFGGLWDGASDTVTVPASASAALGQNVARFLRDGFTASVAYVSGYLSTWWDSVTGTLMDGSRTLGDRLETVLSGSLGLGAVVIGVGALASSLGILGPLVGVLTGGFGLLASVAGTVASAVGALFGGTFFATFVAPVLAGAGELLVTLGGILAPVLQVASAIFSVQGVVVGLAASVAALTVGFLVWPEQTQSIVDRVSGFLRTGMGDAFEWLTTAILGFFGGGSGGGSLLTSIGGALASLPALVQQYVPAVGAALMSALDAIGGMIGSMIHGALDGIERALVAFFPNAAAGIHSVFDGIRVAIDLVGSVFHGLVATVGPLLTGLVSLVVNVVTTVWNTISPILGGAISAIGDLLGGVFSLLRGAVSLVANVVGGAIDLVVSQFHVVTTFFSEFFGGLRLLFSDPVAGITQMGGAILHFFTGSLTSIGTFILRAGAGLLDFLRGIGGFFTGVGAAVLHLVGGLVLGVVAYFRGMFTTIQGVVGTTLSAVGAFLVGLVSSWAETITAYFSGFLDTVLGFVARVSEGWSGLGDSARWVLDQIVGFFTGLATSATATLTNLWAWITTGLAGMTTSVATTFTSIVETIRVDIETAIGFVTNFKDRFLEAINGIWDRVMGVFGHSVNSVVGDDLAQTNAISSQWSTTFQGHAQQAFDSVTEHSGEAQAAATQFQNLLAQGLVDVLVRAFTTGYADVIRATGRFTAEASLAYGHFAAANAERFAIMWAGLVGMSDSALLAIESGILRATAGVARLQALAHSAQGLTVSATITSAESSAQRVAALGHDVAQTDLFNAMHAPDWYEKDFRDRYERKMDALIAAVREGNAAGARGGRGGAAGASATAASVAADGQRLVASLGGT